MVFVQTMGMMEISIIYAALKDCPPHTQPRLQANRHEGHISGIRNTWSAIYNNWLPNSGFKLTDMPEFELYSEDFDPVEETGSVSIYIPVATA